MFNMSPGNSDQKPEVETVSRKVLEIQRSFERREGRNSVSSLQTFLYYAARNSGLLLPETFP